MNALIVAQGEIQTSKNWPHPLALLCKKKKNTGTSLVVQWLRLHAFNAGDTGSIPGQGTKIPHAE